MTNVGFPIGWRRWLVATFVLVGVAVFGKAPDWAQPLLAQNVDQLGHGYHVLRLADLEELRYGSDERLHTTIRGGLRVLTEAGLERAICSVNYNADTQRVLSARAWVVSADGSRTQAVYVSDFTDFAARWNGIYWPQSRILQFSAADRIEIHGALVWELELESRDVVFDQSWTFLDDLPTLVSALDVIPPPDGQVIWHAEHAGVPAPTPGAKPGSLHWEERNHRPPGDARRPAGFFPATRTLALRAIYPGGKGSYQSWTELAGMANGVIEPRIASASPELKAKAAELVAGKTDRWDRIRALANFVQRDITYLSVTLDKDILAGYRPHKAAEVLQNRYGDCKDKTTLFIAMLRAVGDDGRAMLVFSGNPIAVQPDWPSPRFNHVITCIPANGTVPDGWPVVDAGPLGKMVLFDPTNWFTPLGLLPREDEAGYGLVVSPQSTGLVALPVGAAGYRGLVDATLDPLGNLTVKVAETWTGTLAAERHSREDLVGPEKYTGDVEARLHTNFAVIDALHWKDNWRPKEAVWAFDCDFVAPHHVGAAGSVMMVNPQLLATRTGVTPWKTHLEGVVWSPAATYHSEVKIALPAGATIDEMPDDWKGEAPDAAGSVKYRRDGQAVVCEVDITHQAVFLDRAKYEAQRVLLQKVDAAERRPIVVRIGSGVAAGN